MSNSVELGQNGMMPAGEPGSVVLSPVVVPGREPSSPTSDSEQEGWVSDLTSLLSDLHQAAIASHSLPPVIGPEADNELIQVRLGVASGLYVALRCKHAAAAGHALRVALTASAWALQMRMATHERDAIELAALLHDIGYIGVPDHILLKPGALDRDEASLMSRSWAMSLEILQACCASREVLEIVGAIPVWFNGGRPGYEISGDAIPIGARMIAIVDAFDAMTTDHVYRPAMPYELAMTELFQCAGAQFCPKLVRRFAEFELCDQAELRRETASRWLGTLDREEVHRFWHLAETPIQRREGPGSEAFPSALLDNTYDAVVFVDAAERVLLWNRATERLSGVNGESMVGRHWDPELLQLRDERGQRVTSDDCPLHAAIRSGVQALRRMSIAGRSGRAIDVDAHCIPVTASDGTMQGAILQMHDASSETSLEQRCQTLREKATRDSLTQVANRAEFDRSHASFVQSHQEQQTPCSLMICDLDRFKQVNDTYGHQAGDDAIKTLAAILKHGCRPGDLVARYGGEEFVMLCAACDNASAARRAEAIRAQLAQSPQPKLDGRCITASFGVTEIQPGDTPETMLRRADRALLMAKAKGRNTVVQLGSGSAAERTRDTGAPWIRRPSAEPREELVLEQVLVTPVPVKMAIEKLRGFVADHEAKITSVSGSNLHLEINDTGEPMRRRSDRPVTFLLDLRFEEEHVSGSQVENDGSLAHTRIEVTVRPKKSRDRRRNDVADRAREVLVSLRSYLIASVVQQEQTGGTPHRRRRFLPWFWWK